MKNLVVSLIGALTVGAALPAFAGPDFQAIEHARKAHREAQLARHGATEAPASAVQKDQPSHALVLPLDHGPRAQTTPWLNKQRVLRAEAQAPTSMAGVPEIATADQPSSR